MAQQTSRMYGVKVKEKVNYYEFGDAGSGNQITLSYENKVWTVKAGGNNAPIGDVSWFMNGVEYQKGDTIVTFNDGDKVSYTIMEQDRSETPYVNLMYDVHGNSAGNSKYGTSDIVYKVTSGDINIYPTYTCKVYKMENGIITNEKSFTNKDINKHKQMYEQGITNNPLYTVFKNIAFDWNEETLMFTAISNSNYIKYNNNTYSKNETIRSFRTTVFEGFEIVDETNKNEVIKVDSDALPTVILIKRRGGLTMMSAQKDHDTIYSNVMHDHKDAYYNGHYHDAMFLVYDNPTVDGCWKKKLKSIAVTYADPYWFLMTTAAGIEYGGRTYESRKLIRTWKPETSVNITLKQNISRRKPIPDNENYDRFVYNVVEEDGQDTVFVYYYQIVATEDEEGIHDEYVLVDSVGFTSSDAQEHNPINWKNIKFKLENNVWTIMTRNAYITYEGRELKSNKPIKSFNVRGAINIEIGDNSDKKGAAADKFVYDVEESEGQDSITVKFQQVVNQKDAQGHNHKSYIDIETTTFSSSDSVVTFRNIQFKVKNNLWTIYSKCGYIKFNGRMYPNNRSILSFAVSEAIHIEIADESNIYEVKEQRIYNIKTPNSEVTVGYSVITSEMTRALKLVKMSGNKEEPWVTVNFYEAMYEPYAYDDISVRYDAKETKWELYSNSDDLYLNGTNYKLGSKIGESWSYYTFVKLTGITVIHANSEALQISVQIIKDGKVANNVDIDEDIGWYDPEDLDFHLGYSYAKGLWVFRAIHNCWVEGINYPTGSVIKSFKTRLNVDQFTMMFRHYDDEEHPDIPTNVLYYITTIVDPFSGVTTINVDCHGYGSNSYSDKDTSKEADKAYTFTKADAKSMYGYIWKRFGGPTPPPGPRDYDWDIFAIGVYDDYNGYKIVIAIDTTFGRRYAKRLYQTGDYAVLRDMGSYSLDGGDVGYLSTNYAENHNMSLNRLECVVYGNESNMSVSIRSSVSGHVINILSGSNNVEVFNISIDEESSTINKKIYSKYLNSIISETTTTTGPMLFDVNLSFFCISGRRLYIHQGLTYRSITQGSIGCLVIDMDTCELIETKHTINIDVDAIVEEMWSTISSIEKEVFFSNSIMNAKNTLLNGGVGHSAYINDEMIVNAGVGGVVYTSTYGRVALFWFKFYRFNPVDWTLSVISTNYGESNVPAYYGLVQNTRNKQLCTYVQDYAFSANIDIYELSEYSIDGLINAEKLATIDPTDTVQLWRLDTNSYQTFTKGQIFEAIRAYGGHQRQTLPYSTRSSRFKTYTSGNFGYIQNNYDRWIICIKDETLQDFTGSFCFLASELYSRGTLDEHSYRPDPQLQT